MAADIKNTVNTIKMKFVGHFRGKQKVVALPIPFISKSQQLDEELVFERSSDRTGPAFCDVPVEWAGSLMAVGGNWQVADKLTPELSKSIDSAHAECKARMDKFALENELV